MTDGGGPRRPDPPTQGMLRPASTQLVRQERRPGEGTKLERLCRCVSRPPLVGDRLALSASGQVRDTLKTPNRDGTTDIVLEPLDLMARLAAR